MFGLLFFLKKGLWKTSTTSLSTIDWFEPTTRTRTGLFPVIPWVWSCYLKGTNGTLHQGHPWWSRSPSLIGSPCDPKLTSKRRFRWVFLVSPVCRSPRWESDMAKERIWVKHVQKEKPRKQRKLAKQFGVFFAGERGHVRFGQIKDILGIWLDLKKEVERRFWLNCLLIWRMKF